MYIDSKWTWNRPSWHWGDDSKRLKIQISRNRIFILEVRHAEREIWLGLTHNMSVKI